MKFLKLAMLAVIVSFIGQSAYVWAVDATAHIRTYADQGRSAGYVTNVGLTAVLDADGNYGISTDVRFQLQRKVMHVPLTTTSAGVDTLVDQLFAVPSGQTITIEEINLSAHTEIDEATDSLHIQIVRYLGTAKGTQDTIVAPLVVDNDSLTVYADTIFTMTLLDSVFTAGDIVQAWLMAPGGAISGGDGAGLTIKYRLDE